MRRCDLAPRTRSRRHEHQVGRARPDGAAHCRRQSADRGRGRPGPRRRAAGARGARGGRGRRAVRDRRASACPGSTTTRTAASASSRTCPGPWAGHPLGAPLSEALGVPVRLINDARAFTLAEARVGAGQGCASLVGVTLGTGVGGGIVLDGRLVLGRPRHRGRDRAPGHRPAARGAAVRLRQHRLPRVVRRRAAALARAAGTATAADAFAADQRGDPRAHAAVEAWIDYLAIGLANVVTMLTPDRIVLGGGVPRRRRASSRRCASASRARAPDRPGPRRDRARRAGHARGRHRRRPARPRRLAP